MRIAYMLTSLGIGGAERQVVELAERMAAAGHKVVLVVLRSRRRHEWPAGVEILRLDMTRSPLGVLGGLLRGRRILRRFRPDVLHSHTFPANLTARVFRLLGAAPKVVSTIHNIYEGDWKRTLAYRLTDPLSNCITAVSRAVADRYMQIGAVSAGKVSIIANGVDVEAFAPARTSAWLEVSSGQARHDFVWLAAGRAVPAKDFDNLLAAFTLVRSVSPQAQLWIAGEQNERDDRISGQVAGSAGQVRDGIRRLGLCRDMAATLAAADAFVLSSAWEGMPLVVAEAMAMEKPVVATEVGGVRELVGENGLLIPAKDPQALARAMLKVMSMAPGEHRAMGRAARTRILQHFDMNAKADEWESLYAQLMGTPGAGEASITHGRLMNEFPDGANEE